MTDKHDLLKDSAEAISMTTRRLLTNKQLKMIDWAVALGVALTGIWLYDVVRHVIR